MDNFTLLTTLNIVLGFQIVFTFMLTRSAGDTAMPEWRISSILIFFGFFLLLLQKHFPPLISVVFANYFIAAGFYCQVSAALTIAYRHRIVKTLYGVILSALYFALFLFFTYIDFNTSMRIISISAILVVIYGYGVLKLRSCGKSTTETSPGPGELRFLFLAAMLIYVLRIVLTSMGTGAVKSLFDRNIPTTAIFIFLIIYNLGYLMGMFNISLRYKTRIALKEKEKLSYLFSF